MTDGELFRIFVRIEKRDRADLWRSLFSMYELIETKCRGRGTDPEKKRGVEKGFGGPSVARSDGLGRHLFGVAGQYEIASS